MFSPGPLGVRARMRGEGELQRAPKLSVTSSSFDSFSFPFALRTRLSSQSRFTIDVHAAARKLSALILNPAVASLPAKPPSQHIQYEHARNSLLKAFDKLPNKSPLFQGPQAQRVL